MGQHNPHELTMGNVATPMNACNKAVDGISSCYAAWHGIHDFTFALYHHLRASFLLSAFGELPKAITPPSSSQVINLHKEPLTI